MNDANRVASDDAAVYDAGMCVNMDNLIIDVEDDSQSRMHVCVNAKACLT